MTIHSGLLISAFMAIQHKMVNSLQDYQIFWLQTMHFVLNSLLGYKSNILCLQPSSLLTKHSVVNSLLGPRPYILLLTLMHTIQCLLNSLQGNGTYTLAIYKIQTIQATFHVSYTLELTAFKTTDHIFCG